MLGLQANNKNSKNRGILHFAKSVPTQNETQDKKHSIANNEALNPTTKDIKTKSQIPNEIVGYCNFTIKYVSL